MIWRGCLLALLLGFASVQAEPSPGWNGLGPLRAQGPGSWSSPVGGLQVSWVDDTTVHVQAWRGAHPLPSCLALDSPPPEQSRAFSPISRGWTCPGASLTVEVSGQGCITFRNRKGGVICQDHPDFPMAFGGGGFRVWKKSPLDEHYFGLGDRPGPLDRREQSCTLWNTDAYLWQESTDPLYKSIPFFLALRGGQAYGIYLNNSYRSNFDFQKQLRDGYSFGSEGGRLDYYFFAGPEPKAVLRGYTRVVGRMPLPPLYSLGYQQSRGSYMGESVVRAVADKIRQHRIPCDVLYLDGDYKDKARPFSVDAHLFPDLKSLFSDLKKQGFRTVMSLDPYLAYQPGHQDFEFGRRHGYFARLPDGQPYVGKVWPGSVVFGDFANPQMRRWWGGLHQPFVEAGVGGIWDDMNEPAAFYRRDKTVPLQVLHQSPRGPVTHREFHNLLGLFHTRATYEGLLRLRPGQRPFVLTRSGFAGSWRFAATWTGDNSASWDHMRNSLTQVLNLGVSGYAFCGCDIGGFSGTPGPELLTRWMQLGAYCPLYRNHSDGTTREREPWVDGEEHEAARRFAIEERYRLLPYVYSCVEECHRTGVPWVRPMFLEFPDQEKVVTLGEQFLLGPWLLVAPKVHDYAAPYAVRLPRGKWYEAHTDAVFQGDASHTVDPKLGELPMFVRAGAILLRQPLVQSTGEKPQGLLEVDCYAGEAGQQELYLDDGLTVGGPWLRWPMKLRPQARRGVLLEMEAPKGEFQPWFSQVCVRFHGLGERPWVEVDGGPAQRSSEVVVPLGAHQVKARPD